MISREEFAQEMLLRDNIQKAIAVVKNKKLNERRQEVLNRIKLRVIIKDLILEAAADPDEDPHPSTGINVLRDLIKNTGFLKVIRTGYKVLTTTKEQRDSYRAHILNAMQKALAPIMINTAAGSEEEAEINEDVDIEIEDEEKFIEGEPEKSEEEEEEEEEDPKETERKNFGLEGEEVTGRDRAFDDFNNIEQIIIDHFGMLSNPDDQEKFYDYLIANTKLYFDRYESELADEVEEPTNAAYEDAAAAAEEAPSASPEGDTEEVAADDEEAAGSLDALGDELGL